MKKVIPFFLVIFCFTLSLSAKKDEYLTLSKVTLPVQNLGFKLIKVTNATGNPRLIGTVDKSVVYVDANAFFTEDIEKEVSNFLERNLKKTEATFDLVVRVNEIKISESYNGFNETATAKVNLSFIEKKDGKYFEKFNASMVSSKTAGMGITRSQPTLIGESIAKCFEAFYYRGKENKLRNIEISEEDLFINPTVNQEIIDAFLSADRSSRGIYKTYADFKDNLPDTDTQFEVDYKIRSSEDESVKIKHAKITTSVEDFEIEDIWGFTDGNAIYTAVGKKFLPLQKDEKGFYLELKVTDPSTMAAAGMLGGLVGSSIAYASTPKSKIYLDFETGEFDYSNQLENSSTDTNPAYCVTFFSSSYNHSQSKLKLYINDEFKVELTPTTWFQYELTKENESFKVKIESTNGMVLTEQLMSKTSNDDLYLCIDKKKKAPNLDRVLKTNSVGVKMLMTPENRVFPQIVN